MRAATPSWCTVLSSRVDQEQGSCAQCLGPSAPPEPASRLSSETRVDSFFAQCLKVMTIPERSVQFHIKIGRHWAKW